MADGRVPALRMDLAPRPGAAMRRRRLQRLFTAGLVAVLAGGLLGWVPQTVVTVVVLGVQWAIAVVFPVLFVMLWDRRVLSKRMMLLLLAASALALWRAVAETREALG